jgi:zinc and cadmium transporter
MWGTILVVIYCVLVGLASYAGGTLTAWLRLSHMRMQGIMSFVGGLVLGVGLLHLLPHSASETQSLDQTVAAALAGLLAMFFLIRIFRVHQHGPVEHSVMDGDPLSPLGHDDHVPGRRQDHASDHEPPHECPAHAARDYPLDGRHCAAHRGPYSWIGLGVGLTLHTLIDGMALAASVSAAASAAPAGFSLLGLGTFLAILLHKPLDAMSITSVMTAGGASVRAQRAVNIAFSAMCAAGAAGFYLGIQRFAEHQQTVVGCALGFAGGVFLCISLADILPEVQFHAHDRAKLSAALVLGVALAYAIGFLEPCHQHGHAPTSSPAASQVEPHDHDGH